MKVTTGFGYYVKDGKKLHKYELPLGEHPDPIGFTVVEVGGQEELDNIVLDKSEAQTVFEKKAAERVAYRKIAIGKLTLLGLSEPEINALLA